MTRRNATTLVFTEEQVSEMARLYAMGWSTVRLAAKYGCLGGSIHTRLLARGVRMRPVQFRSPRLSVHSNGYLKWDGEYVHRIVAEAILDRPLLPGESVHHRDGDKTNNHPDNIEVFASHAEHMKAERWRVVWTPERTARLVEMRMAGATHADIAAELGATKYAVDNHARDLVAAGVLKNIRGRRRAEAAWLAHLGGDA